MWFQVRDSLVSGYCLESQVSGGLNKCHWLMCVLDLTLAMEARPGIILISKNGGICYFKVHKSSCHQTVSSVKLHVLIVL